MIVNTFETLFGADKNGKIKSWMVSVDDNQVIVSYGRLGGKLQSKSTISSAKNIGKKNETTPHEQALKDAESKWNKQIDKGYRLTKEEALAAASESLRPMLASDYTKVGHSIIYPCDVSRKLDGVRCIEKFDKVPTFTSRGGKSYEVPSHIARELSILHDYIESVVLDGELYIHGVPLQDIISCVKKHNEMTPDLKFYIFDVPSDEEWESRSESLDIIKELIKSLELEHIKVVTNEFAKDEDDARQIMLGYTFEGYEGLMLRNLSGKYEWNNRSRSLQKWKDFQDEEALVLDFEEDNNQEAVLIAQLTSGIKFRVKMRGNHSYRSISNGSSFVGKWITVRYQQLTKDGAPQFPVGVAVRACDSEGNPEE